ncbi:uncharacterized protein K452DRAFT_307381 [Aplosporella prunicola CBS 121167]|uniref:F-box domain-containing protein n=1 Tax=Aplosporella prunicola CBS 121167 TaxID=1176127 RepID=A0A6A6BGE4_9PEZI|nr:uncharacterized protein K452DRAFT_307381 [Aplosporella prunicola CBS 121167]KAF2143209.1 hypothetical protein K452DRAFT_307381 [Aplosporella prunicola CBS 121167]
MDSSCVLAGLPTEILCIIAQNLEIDDFQALRLVSPILAERTGYTFRAKFFQDLKVYGDDIGLRDRGKLCRISQNEYFGPFVRTLCFRETDQEPSKQHGNTTHLINSVPPQNSPRSQLSGSTVVHLNRNSSPVFSSNTERISSLSAVLSRLPKLSCIRFNVKFGGDPQFGSQGRSLASLHHLLEAIDVSEIQLQEFSLKIPILLPHDQDWMRRPVLPTLEKMRNVSNVQYHLAAPDEGIRRWYNCTSCLDSQTSLWIAADEVC